MAMGLLLLLTAVLTPEQMQAWGFTLKQFTHPKIEGAF